jgi:hypothetical protein
VSHDETDLLQQRVGELEAEVRKLRELQPKAQSENSWEFAALLYRDYLQMEKGGGKNPDPEMNREFLGRLDGSSASHFISNASGSPGMEKKKEDERTVALELTLASGGPAAAEFVNLLLHDPTLDPSLREDLLQELSGMGGGFFSIRQLLLTEGLTSTALVLTKSAKEQDRQGGAGVLGGVRTEASRTELRHMVEHDPNMGVRSTAAMSLGHVGDPSTQTFLENFWVSKASTLQGQEGARLSKAIEGALKKLAEGPR